ncbi:uncharacterized protein LOC134243731 isoform X2 [Saccostrea cucullata]|uniref:uncharacterized protein LOC134243731 isoform X2 n=1 Tax=Saccostrea cuccullata TaxID=36930 RepID=UPI002ECFE4EB
MALAGFIVHLIFTPACSAQCEGHGYRECCSGYKWDEIFKNCTKCRPGYFGVNCAQSCAYPSYGDGCQQECKCQREECSVSSGCTGETTTYLHTTKQTTMKTEMSTVNRIFLSTSTITEKDAGIYTSSRSVTQKITSNSPQTLFTTQNFLIMGIFGVGLILLTLCIVFLCKCICRKFSSKRRLRSKTDAKCPNSALEEIHYEEISNISIAQNTGFSYSPLQQNESEDRNKSLQNSSPFLENSLEKSTEKIALDDYENTMNSTVSDPQNQQVPVTDSGSTDLEGYQLPHNSSIDGASGSIEEDCVKEEPYCNERSDYLTVISTKI